MLSLSTTTRLAPLNSTAQPALIARRLLSSSSFPLLSFNRRFSSDVEPLAHFVRSKQRLAVLTGAGVSTDSGIPDYRSPGRKPANPMTFNTFFTNAAQRQRYWARSFLGIHTVMTAQPNTTHLALAELEASGTLSTLITQNVDSLHNKAGSRNVIELHGRLADVVCLGCGTRSSRSQLQKQFLQLNAQWLFDFLEQTAPSQIAQAAETVAVTHMSPEQALVLASERVSQGNAAGTLRPDGDVSLEETSKFVVPDCGLCGGMLKPDVVFFGENVPIARVRSATELVQNSDGLLVLGSSLHVWSGRRFVDQAHRLGLPIAIVNVGPTASDQLATLRVHTNVSQALRFLVPDLKHSNHAPLHATPYVY